MNLPMAPTTLPMAPATGAPPALSSEEIARMQAEVRALAAERGAVILAHNYQVPEVQDVADYVGDSLGLSRKAAAAEGEVIVFCGVHFMAETASILCPEKTVLIPDLDAGCSLADSIDAAQLADWKAQYPEGVVVMYVNTTAEVKALTDYCCTSANAVDVVRHIYETRGEDTEILFGPDMWLGAYVEKEIGKAHARVGRRVPRARGYPAGGHRRPPARRIPDADFLIHPECGCTTSIMEYVASRRCRGGGRTHALDRRECSNTPRSWSASRARAAEHTDGAATLATGAAGLSDGAAAPSRRADQAGVSQAKPREAVVATEIGMLHPLRMAAPDVSFIPANPGGELQVHEDDHFAEAEGRAARHGVRGACRSRGDRPPRQSVPIDRMVAIG